MKKKGIVAVIGIWLVFVFVEGQKHAETTRMLRKEKPLSLEMPVLDEK
jgi:hypothetical protein